ncbi:MAG: hypothetical protein FD155_598 [Bacteroidetes bacterium]|nr:MAG: hypothetical protein FD155_598 [Bacteroidota bacterium]
MKDNQLKLIFVILAFSFCLNAKSQIPNWQWAKSAGSTGYDGGTYITSDAAGNVYTTGYFEGTVDFDPSAGILNLTAVGGSDIYLLKLDPSGNLNWAKSIGGLTTDNCKSIAFDTLANVYLTGTFQGTADFDPGASIFNLTAAGYDDVFILKLDSSGNFIWAKAIGAIDYDQGYSITVDDNNDLLTCGSFSSTVDFDPGVGVFNLTSPGWDAFILKLTSAGDFVWAKQLDGSNGYAQAKALTTDSAGNIYTVGEFEGTVDFDPGVNSFNISATAGATNVFISKLDSAGNFVWAKAVVGYAAAYVTSITLDAAQNIYFSGYFYGTLDLDPGPATVIVNSFDGEEDVFFIKLDNAGNYLWGKTFGGMGTDAAWGLTLDSAANLYLTGTFRSTFDFDPGAAVFNMTPLGIFSIYISEFDSAGNFVHAIAAGGTGADVAGSIAIDNNHNLYLTGRFGSPVVSFGTHTILNASATGWDTFIAKLGDNITGIESLQSANMTSIYPNPANDFITVKMYKASSKTSIKIYNSTMQLIKALSFENGIENIISTTDLNNGHYIIDVQIEGQSFKTKFVVSR